MLNERRSLALGLSAQERDVLSKYGTAEEFQAFLRTLPYDFEEDGVERFPSFRQALREGKAHCFAGAVMGAAYLFLHDQPPLIVCIEAADYDHNLAVYWRDGKVGSIGASRHVELTGKGPRFASYEELVRSYYPDSYNDITDDPTDLTMRGFSAPVDLRMFGSDWVTGERDLTEIEDYLFAVPYRMLLPEKPELYAGFPKAGPGWYDSPRLQAE